MDLWVLRHVNMCTSWLRPYCLSRRNRNWWSYGVMPRNLVEGGSPYNRNDLKNIIISIYSWCLEWEPRVHVIRDRICLEMYASDETKLGRLALRRCLSRMSRNQGLEISSRYWIAALEFDLCTTSDFLSSMAFRIPCYLNLGRYAVSK